MQWVIGTCVKTNEMNRRSGKATGVYTTSLRKKRILIGDILPRSAARRPFRLRPWLGKVADYLRAITGRIRQR